MEEIWRGPNRRPVLTAGLAKRIFREANGLGHVGVTQMERNLCHWWHPHLKDMAQEHVRTCRFCRQYNSKVTVKPEMGKFPLFIVVRVVMKVELVEGIMAGLLRASKVMVEVRMELVVE